MQNKQCYKCGNGLQMPDGSAWCQLTNAPRDCKDADYVKGFPKLYKMEINRPSIHTRQVEVSKKPVIAPVVKPRKPRKSKSVTNKPERPRLF